MEREELKKLLFFQIIFLLSSSKSSWQQLKISHSKLIPWNEVAVGERTLMSDWFNSASEKIKLSFLPWKFIIFFSLLVHETEMYDLMGKWFGLRKSGSKRKIYEWTTRKGIILEDIFLTKYHNNSIYVLRLFFFLSFRSNRLNFHPKNVCMLISCSIIQISRFCQEFDDDLRVRWRLRENRRLISLETSWKSLL